MIFLPSGHHLAVQNHQLRKTNIKIIKKNDNILINLVQNLFYRTK